MAKRILWLGTDDRLPRKHLDVHVQHGRIILSALRAPPTAKGTAHSIAEADIVLVPMSADNLLLLRGLGALDRLRELHLWDAVLVVPVRMQPCECDPWLSDLQSIPKDQYVEVKLGAREVTQCSAIEQDAAFSVVAKRIGTILDDGRSIPRKPAWSTKEIRELSLELQRIYEQLGWQWREPEMATIREVELMKTARDIHEKLRSGGRLIEGDIVGGRYLLLGRLGEDSVSTLWAARDKKNGDLVHVHALFPHIAEDLRASVFEWTAARARALHSALPRMLVTQGVDDVVPGLIVHYYVTELTDGSSARHQAFMRPLPPEQAVSLVLHLTDGVAALHAQGLIHRDIRPENVLMSNTRMPLLAGLRSDFPGKRKGQRNMRSEDQLYLAPELRRGGVAQKVSDVYSLGATLLFFLRGSELPALSERALRLLIDGIEAPPRLRTLLAKAMASRPERRFSGAREVSDELIAISNEMEHERPRMIALGGGSFTMGSAVDDPEAHENQKPPREVTVSSFEMAEYPVTQELYERVMLSNPSFSQGDELPVNRVTFREAAEFCNRLSYLEGMTADALAYRIDGDTITRVQGSKAFRLPTEAEWEYAARGKEGRKYPWGKEPPANQLCWNGEGTDVRKAGRRGPSPVGYYAGRTPEGIADLAGNVWEWCWDFASKPYDITNVNDPAGPATGELRILRGAGWTVFEPTTVRAAARSREVPGARDPDIGFRYVRSL